VAEIKEFAWEKNVSLALDLSSHSSAYEEFYLLRQKTRNKHEAGSKQSSASEVFQQCGNRHSHPTMQHILVVGLEVYFEFSASVCHAASDCNMHCLSSHTFPDNAQGLVPANTRTVWM
jgi:hypothetical protein